MRSTRETKRAAVERVYGLAAALAAFEARAGQVVSIAYTRGARAPLAEMLRKAARLRIAYREVEDEELARMAGSEHHEGVCLLARPYPRPSLEDMAKSAEPGGLLVALDRVGNPHNAGAVLRSAAFFGVRGLIAAEPERPLLTPAATRVAEGGAEHVRVLEVKELAPALRTLRELGMNVVGAEAAAPEDASELRWPARAVLVLGSERDGLAPPVRSACQKRVRIRGTGAIESLNVSVAAGILFASYAAKHGVE